MVKGCSGTGQWLLGKCASLVLQSQRGCLGKDTISSSCRDCAQAPALLGAGSCGSKEPYSTNRLVTGNV